MGQDVDDLIDTLTLRRPVLELLAGGPREKRTLVADLEVSQPTVDRAIRDLEDLGLVERRSGSYALTDYGALVYDVYRELTAQLDHLTTAGPLFEHLPDDLLDEGFVADSQVVIAERPAPREPIHRLERLAAGSSTVTGFTPVTLSRNLDLLDDLVDDGQRTVDLMTVPDVISYHVANNPNALRRIVASDNCTVRTIRADRDVGIFVVDRRHVWCSVYDASGGTKGALVNTTERGVEWALSEIERLRADAGSGPLDPGEIDPDRGGFLRSLD